MQPPAANEAAAQEQHRSDGRQDPHDEIRGPLFDRDPQSQRRAAVVSGARRSLRVGDVPLVQQLHARLARRLQLRHVPGAHVAGAEAQRAGLADRAAPGARFAPGHELHGDRALQRHDLHGDLLPHERGRAGLEAQRLRAPVGGDLDRGHPVGGVDGAAGVGARDELPGGGGAGGGGGQGRARAGRGVRRGGGEVRDQARVEAPQGEGGDQLLVG